MINEYRGLTIRPVEFSSLAQYLELFKAAFPGYKTSVEYLDWLYFRNPNGVAVGFDAFDGDSLISHYVCIPIILDVFKKPALLALNTATHPKYQGRGLLKVLANNTYELSHDKYSCVVGVANANAIKPLTKHLEFTHMGDLELRFGRLETNNSGRRSFSEREIEWRSECPNKRLRVRFLSNEFVKFTRRMYGVIPISAISPIREIAVSGEKNESCHFLYGLTLDWRKNRKPLLFLPKRFKPSPLSFVFRSLSESDSSNLAAWTFPDFDAL